MTLDVGSATVMHGPMYADNAYDVDWSTHYNGQPISRHDRVEPRPEVALKYAELGVAYVFMLGLEAVLAFCFGALFFGENVSVPKVLGVVLIIGGFALLHVGATPGTR